MILDRETTRVLVEAVRVFIVELFALEDRTELPAIGEGVVAIGAEDFRTPPRGRRPLPCRQLTSRLADALHRLAGFRNQANGGRFP
jgi:hypothetical protein